MIYGPPGVGKTTWANGFPDTLFLAPEDGQRHVEAFVEDIGSWKQYKEKVQEIRGKEGRRFKTVAVDTIDELWNQCAYHIGKQHGFDHPSEEDWGKGYQLIKEEFRRGLNALLQTGKGVIFISHAEDKEVKTRTITLTKTMPTLSKSARKVVLPLVTVLVYAGFKTIKDKDTGKTRQKRIAICCPRETLEAKDRTGRLPEVLPLKAKAFMEAYKGN